MGRSSLVLGSKCDAIGLLTRISAVSLNKRKPRAEEAFSVISCNEECTIMMQRCTRGNHESMASHALNTCGLVASKVILVLWLTLAIYSCPPRVYIESVVVPCSPQAFELSPLYQYLSTNLTNYIIDHCKTWCIVKILYGGCRLAKKAKLSRLCEMNTRRHTISLIHFHYKKLAKHAVLDLHLASLSTQSSLCIESLREIH